MSDFRPFKIVTQTDHVEAGGMMDDCAWASLAGIANHVTGSSLDCGDGIAIGEKVGRHDRDGKGDGSSLAQMKKGGELIGLKGRYPKSWDEVVAALADPSCALAVSVQQPIGYPEAVMPISKWHKNIWTPWAKKTDPKGFKNGYGHLTAAAGYHQPFGAQWACPTRSGKGVEALAQPLTIDEFKMIASSHGDAPHKRVLIFTPAKGSAVLPPTIAVEAPQKPQVASKPLSGTKTAPAKPQASAVSKSTSSVDPAVQTQLDALKKVNWQRVGAEALNVAQDAATAASKETTTMGKIGAWFKYVAANTKIDEMLLDALRTFLTVSISVALGLGIPLLDISGGDFRTILSAGLASALSVLVKALDPNQSEYGFSRK